MASEADVKPWLRSAPKSYVLANANVVDTVTGKIRPNTAVKLQDARIVSVSDSNDATLAEARQEGFEVIDCKGKYLSPGLIDAHVHLVAVPGFTDLSKAFGNPDQVSLLRQPYVCSQILHRGFTTVRDCGGATLALKEAISEGVIVGPRLFIAGHALSQSGGHADFRSSHDPSFCCGGAHSPLGRVCNGVAQCMQAVREEIRTGSDFIKIMGSGGVSSPTDKITHLQYTGAEIRAMTECAANAGTYATAHAYTPAAIRHCVENGVKGIEHGNFLDAPTAALMAEKGVYLTPTLISYAEMAAPKWKGYLPPESRVKNEEVLQAGQQSLRIASAAGVSLCYGSDLLGPLSSAQTHEFALRAAVLSPLEILQSATINPARMIGQAQYLGQISDGFAADILILAENPLDDVKIFDDPESFVLGVIKEGRIYKSRWQSLVEDAAIPIRVKAQL